MPSTLPSATLDELTGSWQLFLDDAWLDAKVGVRRVYHPLTRHAANPVMRATQPWEDSYAYVYGRVMHQEADAGYRMWYSVLDFTATTGGSRVLYATSADGLAWTKPNLGLRTWNGSTANNMFIPRDRPNHIMSVLFTPGDASCRYKFINYDGAHNGLPGGYDGACSADGLHLTDLPQNPVVTAGGDVAQFTYDPWQKRYLGYLKVAATVSGYRRRAVGLLTSPDGRSWNASSVPVVLQPDAIDDAWATSAGLNLLRNRTHFYGVSVFPYQSMFLGMVWMFRAKDPANCGRDCAPPYEGYIFGKIHLELVSSRDGVTWRRVDGDAQRGRPALLDLGPAGSWDSMMLFTANYPLLEGDRLKVYYGGCNEDHGRINSGGSCSVGLATLRKDGFASLDATAQGSVTTLPIEGAGGAELRVNFHTQAQGTMRVEVQDGQGQPLPGYAASDSVTLQGDQVNQRVTWGGHDVLPPMPCRLRLKFVLDRAELYSFSAGPTARLAQ